MITDPNQRMVSKQAVELCTRIRAGHANLTYFAHYLEYLLLHLPEGRIVPALTWLVRNGQTGQRFLLFVQNECGNSALELFRYLTMKIENDRKLRAINVRDIRS